MAIPLDSLAAAVQHISHQRSDQMQSSLIRDRIRCHSVNQTDDDDGLGLPITMVD